MVCLIEYAICTVISSSSILLLCEAVEPSQLYDFVLISTNKFEKVGLKEDHQKHIECLDTLSLGYLLQ